MNMKLVVIVNILRLNTLLNSINEYLLDVKHHYDYEEELRCFFN